MLLSLDRLLQLLAEGKGVKKISEMAKVDEIEIFNMIEDIRKILITFDKEGSKKKIIIKRKGVSQKSISNVDEIKTADMNEEIFQGAELTLIPVYSSLLIYVDGASTGNPGPAGIGIVIFDKEDRQVGKVSCYIGKGTNNYAEYMALIRGMKIAIYFNTKNLKIRSDSELVVKQIRGEYKVNSKNIIPLFEEAVKLKAMFQRFRIEHVPRNLNDKADYLAKKAVSSIKKNMK